jgi:hypothetical protein
MGPWATFPMEVEACVVADEMSRTKGVFGMALELSSRGADKT